MEQDVQQEHVGMMVRRPHISGHTLYLLIISNYSSTLNKRKCFLFPVNASYLEFECLDGSTALQGRMLCLLSLSSGKSYAVFGLDLHFKTVIQIHSLNLFECVESHSFIFNKHFILVRDTVDPEPILDTCPHTGQETEIYNRWDESPLQGMMHTNQHIPKPILVLASQPAGMCLEGGRNLANQEETRTH